MVTKDPAAKEAGRGGRAAGGRGGRGRDGKGRGKAAGENATARRLQELDGHSVEAESNVEILRAQRAQARKGFKQFKDIRENEGVDEDDPLNSIDDGIRLEPFNMRREMREGHFDESGFYVLNKDEEKKVTDAWLDTVDQAERTATFMAAEKQNQASTKAQSTISAMAKNLGPDSEGEDEEDKDDKDEEDEEEKKKAEEAAKAQEEEQEKDKEAEESSIITMLEELVSFLQPLETPAMALSRVRRGTQPKTEPALKTRARLRQNRAEVARVAVTAQETDADRKPKRKKLNEWGVYEEGAEKEAAAPRSILMEEGTSPPATVDTVDTTTAAAPATTTAPSSETVKTAPVDTGGDEVNSAEPKLAKAEAARAAAAAAVKAEQLQAAERAKEQAQSSSVTSPQAVAEAAARAAEDERAAAEAAKAFAAEMKMSRNIARALVPEQGPEAAAIVNLNSEETRDVREKAMPKAPEEQPADGPPRPDGKRQKISHTDAELEKREKINRLTDLCDRLLERGVLVYDSARELLAIDVRQRKEQLATESADGSGLSSSPPAAATAATAAAPAATEPVEAQAKAQPEVLYTNKRFKASDGSAAVTEVTGTAASDGANTGTAAASLFWQFRWGHNVSEVNGPFDSVTMQGWVMQGCFSEERPAEVRQCNERNEPQEQCWHPWDRIDFELYI